MSASYIHTQRKTGKSQIVLRLLAFLYFIGLAACIGYLWFFTQDRYISTAEFKISHQNMAGADAGLVQLALPGLSDSGSVDSQIAIGYINSADLLLELEKKFDLIGHYSSPAKDRVFRLERDATLEDRLKYYRSRILAHFDKETGMTVITVDSFSPALSKEIASELLVRAEDFINFINQQIADQQLSFVRGEVERTADRVEELNKELITLQNEHNLINPDDVISANLQAVQEMKMDVLRSEAELSSVRRDSPNSPRIETLRSHIRSVNELIDIESSKLTGPEKDRMGQLLVQFKQLSLKIEFATRLRSGAEAMLEKNRVEAVAHSKFFTVIQNPYLPEAVAIPRREYATGVIIVVGILLFLILRILTLSVFERV